MVERIDIRPEMLSWAINRSGQDVDLFLTTHLEVDSWIKGEKKPTVKQLEAFAEKVHVPMGYLFLHTPPVESIPFPVFRGNAETGHFSLNVFDTVANVGQRQSWLETYLIDNEIPRPMFVGAVNQSQGVSHAVSMLRSILHLEPRWAFDLKNPELAVNKLAEQIEDAGVFIAFNGVVGSNTHRPIDVEECRGFALVNPVAPYIFINSQDAKTAQLFTLAHEMAHLLIGVSAGHAGEIVVSHNATERFCDAVAAEFLVPADVLRTEWNTIKKCASKFKVSELVIARRAHDLGIISDAVYNEFYHSYLVRPIPSRKSPTGGDFYATSRKRIGRMFAVHVSNAVNSRQLSRIEAYRMTGLYGDTFNHFMQLV